MNRTRAERLRALREAHDDWTRRHAPDAGTRFQPDSHPKPDSDYNIHNVTIDADADAQDEWSATAARILNLT